MKAGNFRQLDWRVFLTIIFFLAGNYSNGQGRDNWVRVLTPSPDYNNGVMLLLSDGTVMAKSSHGGNDTIGNLWDKLTPDINGGYVNGTWSKIDSMHYRRLYCSSRVLKDGRVYVAGGEYGNGAANGEIYDPLTGTWTMNGAVPGGHKILDGNSELLPDGKVLQAYVAGGSRGNYIYDPATNAYTNGPTCLGSHDEAVWVKLPDNSVLFVDIGSTNSERYIPALNQWILDDTLPVSLYDPFGFESGAAFLLPDGRVFFIGSLSTTAYYTPSGNNSPGTWAAGPIIPDSLGAPDAAATMMVNGKILCAFSHVPSFDEHFPAPTSFYEFDYLTNTFTAVHSTNGTDTMKGASYITNMLDLPDGNVLFSTLKSNRYYVYVPGGTPVATGKPAINNIVKIDCDKYMATGWLFNGISQGAVYGDDWQMATNYPLIRLVRRSSLYGDYVYYARTHHWNSTGVMTGSFVDTAYFTLPDGLPDDTYDLEVVVNGNPSASYPFTTCTTPVATKTVHANSNNLEVYPNPAAEQATIMFNSKQGGKYDVRLVDVFGRTVSNETANATVGENTHMIHLQEVAKGVYTVIVTDRCGVQKIKVVVE